MLKLLPYEMHKIFSKKLFIGLLISLLIANVFLLWYTNRPNDETAPLEAYRLLAEEIDDLSNEQRLDYITEYYNTMKGIAQVERVRSYEAWQNEQGDRLAENLKNQDLEAYNRYYELWESGAYIRFTQNVRQEEAFADEIYSEMTTLSGYDHFLSDIQSKSETLSGISIFSKNISDGFSSRNIQKTGEDYGRMENTSIQYDISHGVVSAISFLVTDCIVFMFLFVFSFIMVFEEKDRNIYAFIKPTPRGRFETMAAKISALAVYTAVITLLLYGSNLIFFQFGTGLGNLGRSIQSIGIFMGSNISLSVGQFLLCWLLLKWLACFLIGLVVLFASTLFGKLPSAFGLCTALLLGSYGLYTLIPDNSKITMLKHINPFGLFRVQDMLGHYLNLNLFGHPISLFALRLGAMILLTAALTVGSVAVFGRISRAHAVPLQMKTFRWRMHGFTPGKSVLINELFKTLRMNKTGLMLIAFIFFMLYSMVNTTIYLPPDEIVYKSYMNKLEGSVTHEKADFIEKERLRFEDVQNQLNFIDTQLAEGAITDVQALEERQPLERELFKEQAFGRIYERYLYLKEIPGAQFVYEGGYHELFNISKETVGMEYLAICAMLILCCYNIFPMEFTSGISKLLQSTPLGRSYLYKIKLRIGVAFTLVISVFGLMTGFVTTAETYGLSALSAPLKSLEAYAYMPSFLSIGEFLLLCFTLKFLACLTVTLLILTISKVVRNNIYALLLCMFTVALPVLLNAMGLEWAGYMNLVPIFNAGALLSGGKTLQVILYTAVGLVISGSCVCFTVRWRWRPFYIGGNRR